MGLEEKLDSEIEKSAEFRGELRAFMTNTSSWIKAETVNRKQLAQDFKDHVEKTDAHGLGVRAQSEERQGKGFDRWIALGAAIVAGSTLILEVKRAWPK